MEFLTKRVFAFFHRSLRILLAFLALLNRIFGVLFFSALFAVDLFFFFASFYMGFLVAFVHAGLSGAAVLLTLQGKSAGRGGDAFLWFLSGYLFLYYGLRVIPLEALFFFCFLFLAAKALYEKQKLAYHVLLCLALFLRKALWSTIPLPIFLVMATWFFFFGPLSFSYLRSARLSFVVWLFVNFFLASSALQIAESPQPGAIQRIVSQSGVRAVVLYPKEKTFHGQPIRFAFESCDGKSLFLASRSGSSKWGLLRVKLPDLRILDTLPDESVGEMVEQDCKTKTLYFPALPLGKKKTRVLVTSEENLKEIKTWEIPHGKATMYVRVDAPHQRAYAIDDTGLFSVLRLSDGSILHQIPPFWGCSFFKL